MPVITPVVEEPLPFTATRRFVLIRDVDSSGISGTGHVADGVQFADGTCVLRWCGAHASTTLFAVLDDLLAIHGHLGNTRAVFVDT